MNPPRFVDRLLARWIEPRCELLALTYHYIRTPPDPATNAAAFRLTVSPDDFRLQLDSLRARDYTAIAPADLDAALRGEAPLPPRSVLLTFDDGYHDFHREVFPLLAERRLAATLFVITGLVGDERGKYATWDQIREMDRSGLVTIGSHTVSHADLARTPDAERELAESKRALEAELGHPVTLLSYPFGSFNRRAQALVLRTGYELAFTTRDGSTMRRARRFALPRTTVVGGEPFDALLDAR